MPFPTTRDALEANGYRFKESKTCRCGANIEMFDTPRGRVMPLDFKQTEHGEICEPHFASCPYAADYSQKLRDKKKKDEEAAAGDGPMNADA